MLDLVVALVSCVVLIVVFIFLICITTSGADVNSPPPLSRPGQLGLPVYRTKCEDLAGAGSAISVARTDIYGGSGGACGGGEGIITRDTKLPFPPRPSLIPPRPVELPRPTYRAKNQDLISTGIAVSLAVSVLNSGSGVGCGHGGGNGNSYSDGGGGGGGGCGGGC
ncbi:PREDICTED: zinc finger X-linked protein ZXDB-like [Camelina sativa]|uniref:Zinc finger X-linked protein ZXDB-like n=1 Tax=Camelina sativa TaxID=90675 RepID=A0ABM0WAN3_CAMSA|nr:PREDICTED: zinc finger X-linked protein ZXDB-like [Camelina sativa]